jgi:hypothetical protein
MSQNHTNTPPSWAPDCYATDRGWVSAINGELLVSSHFIAPELYGKFFKSGELVMDEPETTEPNIPLMSTAVLNTQPSVDVPVDATVETPKEEVAKTPAKKALMSKAKETVTGKKK